MSNVVEFPTTEKPITEGSTPEYRSADGRARDRGQGRQARKGNVRGVPGRGCVEEAQGGLLRRLARREAVNMSELTPLQLVVDLFDDGDLPVPNPEAAAEIVIQRLIGAGFEIKAQELAQP
jgi:hypothetical protein